MDIKIFNSTIDELLQDGKIENIPIINIDIIKKIIFDKNLNTILFKGFKKNYNDEYGDDDSYLIMKLQDMIYNIHLLVNSILIDKYGITKDSYIYDAICSYIENNSIDIYKAVSYDESDLEELELNTIDVYESLNLK